MCSITDNNRILNNQDIRYSTNRKKSVICFYIH